MTGAATVLLRKVVLLGLSLLCTAGMATAQEEESLLSSRVIGVVQASGAGARDLYRHLDRLVPELRKVPSGGVVKLECTYRGDARGEQNLRRAFQTGSKVEKYLREHHKLTMELWLTARCDNRSAAGPSLLTFSVFDTDPRRFGSVPDLAAKAPAE